MRRKVRDKKPVSDQDDQGGDRVDRQTYTVEEAAKILGICRSLAYRKGVLPIVKIAGRNVVPKRALARMLGE